ncbi:unnamed protein product [Darwinula stevensoni]|uniref:Uncharacterized protein n=1 Tax=Darwinula stevensoni TaxID=69355 RepID=A0A7R8X7E0_9CRUS|nr:unnamed protein product [Darwinula stevensoni]CAG0880373.1 unnamed protein product [Darwinula stevensoni]
MEAWQAAEREEEKTKEVRLEGAVKWLCFVSSITGDFPFGGILGSGGPRFRWLSFPSVRPWIRLVLHGLLYVYFFYVLRDAVSSAFSRESKTFDDAQLNASYGLLVRRSLTAFFAFASVMTTTSLAYVSLILLTLFKGKSLQKALGEVLELGSSVHVSSRRIFLQYSVLFALNSLFSLASGMMAWKAGFSWSMALVTIVMGSSHNHTFLFLPHLSLYLCTLVASAYDRLRVSLEDPQNDAWKSAHLWDRRLKDVVRGLGSSLGLQVSVLLAATIVNTTATLYMVLVELDFRQGAFDIAVTLLPFLTSTLISWTASAVCLRAAQVIREEVQPLRDHEWALMSFGMQDENFRRQINWRLLSKIEDPSCPEKEIQAETFALKKILQSANVLMTGSGFVRLGERSRWRRARVSGGDDGRERSAPAVATDDVERIDTVRTNRVVAFSIRTDDVLTPRVRGLARRGIGVLASAELPRSPAFLPGSLARPSASGTGEDGRGGRRTRGKTDATERGIDRHRGTRSRSDAVLHSGKEKYGESTKNLRQHTFEEMDIGHDALLQPLLDVQPRFSLVSIGPPCNLRRTF